MPLPRHRLCDLLVLDPRALQLAVRRDEDRRELVVEVARERASQLLLLCEELTGEPLEVTEEREAIDRECRLLRADAQEGDGLVARMTGLAVHVEHADRLRPDEEGKTDRELHVLGVRRAQLRGGGALQDDRGLPLERLPRDRRPHRDARSLEAVAAAGADHERVAGWIDGHERGGIEADRVVRRVQDELVELRRILCVADPQGRPLERAKERAARGR